MATQRLKSNSVSFRAASDLSAKQYFAVKMTSTAGAADLAGAGEGDGILINTPASGELADVVLLGGAKVKLGGTVTRGQFGKSDAAGKLVAATANNDKYIVKFLDSGVNGDIVDVLVISGFVGA